MHACMHACIHTYIHIYIYTHRHIFTTLHSESVSTAQPPWHSWAFLVQPWHRISRQGMGRFTMGNNLPREFLYFFGGIFFLLLLPPLLGNFSGNVKSDSEWNLWPVCQYVGPCGMIGMICGGVQDVMDSKYPPVKSSRTLDQLGDAPFLEGPAGWGKPEMVKLVCKPL